jgi:hypothetical protein
MWMWWKAFLCFVDMFNSNDRVERNFADKQLSFRCCHPISSKPWERDESQFNMEARISNRRAVSKPSLTSSEQCGPSVITQLLLFCSIREGHGDIVGRHTDQYGFKVLQLIWSSLKNRIQRGSSNKMWFWVYRNHGVRCSSHSYAATALAKSKWMHDFCAVRLMMVLFVKRWTESAKIRWIGISNDAREGWSLMYLACGKRVYGERPECNVVSQKHVGCQY